MWLRTRSQTDNHVDTAQLSEHRYHPMANQHVANFSYPRTDFAHVYRRDHPGTRDSLGSESSPPPMTEDHGSDFSAEEDPQYRVASSDLWDSWHGREHEDKKPDYPALIKSPHENQCGPSRHERVRVRQNLSMARGPVLSSGSQSSSVASRPEGTSSAHKPTPKVCYSLFPPADVPRRRILLPPQTSLKQRPPGPEPSPLSLHFPPTPVSQNGVSDGKRSAMPPYRPSSSRATTPISVHGGSISAGSSDSIPLLLRSPGPTPPASPPGRASSPGPRSPWEALPKKRSPSHSNLRKFSLSKITTRSSPSLANLAKSQNQSPTAESQHKPLTASDLYDRPLPPLPREDPETPPPQVSVFETDSDDENDEDDDRAGSEAKNFARRLMHGLVHHHLHHDHDKQRDKVLGGSDHKRSVSDDGPSGSKERTGGSRMGISRTLNAATRYRRGGAAAEAADSARAVVSMDLPRQQYKQQGVEEAERGGRFWSSRGSNEFLGRILRRRG